MWDWSWILTMDDWLWRLTISKTLSPCSTSITMHSLTKLLLTYFLRQQTTPNRKAGMSKIMKSKVSPCTSPHSGCISLGLGGSLLQRLCRHRQTCLPTSCLHSGTPYHPRWEAVWLGQHPNCAVCSPSPRDSEEKQIPSSGGQVAVRVGRGRG